MLERSVLLQTRANLLYECSILNLVELLQNSCRDDQTTFDLRIQLQKIDG
jgi:hypothetical protein